MSNKENILNKWQSALGPLGMTGSQLDNISQLLENQANFNLEENKTSEFPNLLPIATKVASQLVSNQILGFASEEEIDAVKKKVKSENRDAKIEAVVEGREFTEKKLEDDEDYKELMKKGVTPLSAPSGVLFYLDYQYADSQKSGKKTRRAGKKHKK